MDRIGVYLRISADPDGSQQATGRQLEDCRAYAARKGWQVADVFEDIDTSAFQRTAKRPEFERMIAALRERAIDGVLVWKVDRLSRRQRDFVRVDEECETSKGFIATVVEGLDTRQPTGRFVAELLVAQARMESEDTSLRVKRAHQQMAQQGRPVTGGLRAYGYTRDRSAIVPEEAELIREAIAKVCNGASLRSITLDWQKRGIVTPTGRPWQATPLRRVLVNPMLAGRRTYQGTTTEGTWEPILTVAEHVKVVAVLGDPTRRTAIGNSRSYLLSGMATCGRCGARLMAKRRVDGAKRYVCVKQPGSPACGRLARLAAPVEELVVEQVLSALENADLTPFLKRNLNGGENALVESITADELALVEVANDYYTERAIGRTEFLSARATLTARLEASRRKLAGHQSSVIMGTITGGVVREQWESKPLEWKRAILGAVIDRVVLKPAVPGRNHFDPALVEIVGRE